MIIIRLLQSLDKNCYKYKDERDKMKLISEEIQQAEYIVEEKMVRRTTRYVVSFYNQTLRIEMAEYMSKIF